MEKTTNPTVPIIGVLASCGTISVGLCDRGRLRYDPREVVAALMTIAVAIEVAADAEEIPQNDWIRAQEPSNKTGGKRR